jgi:membrane-associated phospholipid phosphatase
MSSSEGDWGRDALWPVDGSRVIKAARDAALDPQTWVPAAGALVFTIDHWDRHVSDWAIEHTPAFGSQDGASNASDILLVALTAETVVTALAAPSGRDFKQWTNDKLKGVAVEVGALGVNALGTEALKSWIGRPRPNGEGKSFPSGHASGAFGTATLSNLNLNSIDMPGLVRQAMQIGNLGLASGVAWARVEGGHHYPSDVLAGAALGHFITAFIHDAFMNLPKDGSVDVALAPLEGGGAVSVGWRF